jgi:hypothetical protein
MAAVVSTELRRSAGQTALQLGTGSDSRVGATAVEEHFVGADYYLVLALY